MVADIVTFANRDL